MIHVDGQEDSFDTLVDMAVAMIFVVGIPLDEKIHNRPIFGFWTCLISKAQFKKISSDLIVGTITTLNRFKTDPDLLKEDEVVC